MMKVQEAKRGMRRALADLHGVRARLLRIARELGGNREDDTLESRLAYECSEWIEEPLDDAIKALGEGLNETRATVARRARERAASAR